MGEIPHEVGNRSPYMRVRHIGVVGAVSVAADFPPGQAMAAIEWSQQI